MSKRDDIKAFRSRQYAAYVSQHSGECELEPFLLSRSKAFRLFSLTNQGPLEVAHIWGRHGMACDAFCAIIRISHAAHSWGHVGHHPDYSPHDAVEACSLAAKFARHQDVLAGPAWHRSERQRVERWHDRYNLGDEWMALPTHQWHWHVPSANAARAACHRDHTLKGRIEFLHSKLAETTFADITGHLVRIVNHDL